MSLAGRRRTAPKLCTYIPNLMASRPRQLSPLCPIKTFSVLVMWWHELAQLLEALRYKPEFRVFGFRWWNFLLIQTFRPLYVPGVDSSRHIAWGVTEDGAYGRLSWEPQPAGTLRPVQGFINIFIVVWITARHGAECRDWNVWLQNLAWEWGQENISSCFPLMLYKGTQKIHNDNSKSGLLISYLDIWDKPRNKFASYFPWTVQSI